MDLKLITNSAYSLVLLLTERQRDQKYAQEGIKNMGRVKSEEKQDRFSGFQMPLHYPRYAKEDYEKMEEGKLDLLLKQYGLCFDGTLDEKRAFAIGMFLWPDQL